jgi:hypothetical protein
MHSLSNALINSTSAALLPSPLRSSLGALDLPELDRSASDALSGGGDLQTPTTGRVTDITGMGSPRPSFSTFGGVGLASPFVGLDIKEGAEKQRRFEGENKYSDSTIDFARSILTDFCSLYALHVRLDQVNFRLGHAIVSLQVKDSSLYHKSFEPLNIILDAICTSLNPV